jgi:hypothetical protein
LVLALKFNPKHQGDVEMKRKTKEKIGRIGVIISTVVLIYVCINAISFGLRTFKDRSESDNDSVSIGQDSKKTVKKISLEDLEPVMDRLSVEYEGKVAYQKFTIIKDSVTGAVVLYVRSNGSGGGPAMTTLVMGQEPVEEIDYTNSLQ